MTRHCSESFLAKRSSWRQVAARGHCSKRGSCIWPAPRYCAGRWDSVFEPPARCKDPAVVRGSAYCHRNRRRQRQDQCVSAGARPNDGQRPRHNRESASAALRRTLSRTVKVAMRIPKPPGCASLLHNELNETGLPDEPSSRTRFRPSRSTDPVRRPRASYPMRSPKPAAMGDLHHAIQLKCRRSCPFQATDQSRRSCMSALHPAAPADSSRARFWHN